MSREDHPNNLNGKEAMLYLSARCRRLRIELATYRGATAAYTERYNRLCSAVKPVLQQRHLTQDEFAELADAAGMEAQECHKHDS